MKETWKILKGRITKNTKGKQISTEFNGDESKITGNRAIANGFNNFFVQLLVRHWQKEFPDKLTDKVEETMFLQPVTEEEIMQLVENAKNKKSKDHDQVDMTLCLV